MAKTINKIRRIIIIISMITIPICSYSQKVTKYFDLNNSLISEEIFKNKLKESQSVFSIKKEDSISTNYNLYYNTILFKMDEKNTLDFKNNLQNCSGTKLEKVEFYIISYIHLTNSISFNIEAYKKKVADRYKDKINFQHFIIYEDGYKNKKNRIIDTNNYFKTFCKTSKQDISTIILNSKNEVLINRNDYHITERTFIDWGT
jgi:hypothetical protein